MSPSPFSSPSSSASSPPPSCPSCSQKEEKKKKTRQSMLKRRLSFPWHSVHFFSSSFSLFLSVFFLFFSLFAFLRSVNGDSIGRGTRRGESLSFSPLLSSPSSFSSYSHLRRRGHPPSLSSSSCNFFSCFLHSHRSQNLSSRSPLVYSSSSSSLPLPFSSSSLTSFLFLPSTRSSHISSLSTPSSSPSAPPVLPSSSSLSSSFRPSFSSFSFFSSSLHGHSLPPFFSFLPLSSSSLSWPSSLVRPHEAIKESFRHFSNSRRKTSLCSFWRKSREEKEGERERKKNNPKSSFPLPRGFSSLPPIEGEGETAPPPNLSLTSEDLDFYRELGVSPHAPGWEVQQAYDMKLDEIPDEKKRAIFEEKWLKLYAKRANKDFLAITHRFEQHHLHATEKSSRWIKPLRSLFKEKSLADSLNENDWASELPSESDPTYMSSQTDDVPREMKDIMMGLGDRKGIFKNLLRSSVAQGDEERSRRFFRRFDVKRWRRTGSFFLPLAGIGFFVSKLRSSSLLTSLGLATRYMWMKDKDGEEDDEELGESSSSSSVSQHKRRSTDGRKSVDGKKKKKKLPSLKTILLTGGLLALHAALGVFSVSAFILPAIEDSVGTSFSFITPEGLVASNVILQWWISSNLYRISSVSRKDRNKEDEEEEEEEDEDDDGEDDQDGGEDGRRNGEDGEEDDDLGGGPLADEE